LSLGVAWVLKYATVPPEATVRAAQVTGPAR
jgi:hypothetical protein